MRLSSNKVRVVFMCVLLTIHQGLASEPKCSRFDYEERLLEKMVRLEWQFGRLQEELREARVALVDGRAKADSTLQGHIERLMDAEKMARVSVSESERNMEKVILNVTETANKALLKLDKNIDKQKSAIVVFRARSPSNTVITAENIVVFSEVILNVGAGYAPSTGTFTCPTSGWYMFTVQLCVEKDKSMYFELVKSGTDRLQMSRIYTAGSNQCNTADAFVMLAMNETVTVQATSGHSINIQNSDSMLWNTFAGFLLHQS